MSKGCCNTSGLTREGVGFIWESVCWYKNFFTEFLTSLSLFLIDAEHTGPTCGLPNLLTHIQCVCSIKPDLILKSAALGALFAPEIPSKTAGNS